MNRADLSGGDLVRFGQMRIDFGGFFFVAEWDSAGTRTRSAAAARGAVREPSYAGPL